MSTISTRQNKPSRQASTSEPESVSARGASYLQEGIDDVVFVNLRFGDIVIPHVAPAEPLKLECQYFVDCVRSGATPVSDGRDGMRVVRVLEAAQQSLKDDGVPCVMGQGSVSP